VFGSALHILSGTNYKHAAGVTGYGFREQRHGDIIAFWTGVAFDFDFDFETGLSCLLAQHILAPTTLLSLHSLITPIAHSLPPP
jgi:hypothetical protein